MEDVLSHLSCHLAELSGQFTTHHVEFMLKKMVRKCSKTTTIFSLLSRFCCLDIYSTLYLIYITLWLRPARMREERRKNVFEFF